jgi:hypothetical protein
MQGRAAKEARTIPQVVFTMEQYEILLIKLSKKLKVLSPNA